MSVEGQAAAVTETVAGGLALLAAALGSIRADAGAADIARQALAPVLPLIADAPSGECRSCPVCRLLALARLVSPESVDGLGDAMDALMAALRAELGDPDR